MELKIEDIENGETHFSHFSFLRGGIAYYMVTINDTTYTYPVSLEDLRGTMVFPTMKAITLMRYIRKALADGTLVVSDCARRKYGHFDEHFGKIRTCGRCAVDGGRSRYCRGCGLAVAFTVSGDQGYR